MKGFNFIFFIILYMLVKYLFKFKLWKIYNLLVILDNIKK